MLALELTHDRHDSNFALNFNLRCYIADADVALSDDLLMPAHDGVQRSGARLRVLPPRCFRGPRGGGAVADAAKGFPGKSWSGGGGGGSNNIWSSSGENANNILTSAKFDEARAVVLRDGPIGDGDDNGNCAALSPKQRSGPAPRALRYVAPAGGEFPVGCDGPGDLQSLCDVVRRVAVERRVIVAVSNSNILYMLGLFLDGIKAANISNHIVLALDGKTAAWCKERGSPYYHRELTSLTGSTDNHATSGLKFEVLREFLTVGVSVLLSDVDVVWMRNPFGGSRAITPPPAPGARRVHLDQPAIYGDSDVEGMTDGWDDNSAYGFTHGKAVQVKPMKPVLKAPVTTRLKPKIDTLFPNAAFKFNVRRYYTGARAGIPCAASQRATAAFSTSQPRGSHCGW